MNVTLKKGSAVTIPLLAGMSSTSDAAGIVTAKMNGTSVVLTAVAPGAAKITLQLAADLSLTLSVTVTS